VASSQCHLFLRTKSGTDFHADMCIVHDMVQPVRHRHVKLVWRMAQE
jgi:hypothetical protein